MQSQVLNYSTAKKDDGTFRLDAEHYQEKYLLNQNKLFKFGAVPLHSMISRPVMTGHTPSMKIDSYYGDDVAFVKTDNLREFRITGEFSHRLSQKGNEVIKRSVLQKGDLIMTIIGATYKIVGRSALVRSEDLPANINQNIALIRLKKAYSPEFLSAYLNSNIGKLATWYFSRQTEQVNLNCREIEKILVPKVSKEFALTIENTYKKAVLCEHGSRSAFLKAENLLLAEIGLNHWQPKHQLSFFKNYSDTEQAGRIDAEYYQPKYEEIVKAIKAYKGGWDTLGNLCHTARGSLISDSFYNEDSGKAYIRGADFSGGTLTSEKMIYIDNKFVPKNETKVYFNEIVFSLIGSVGETALVTEEFNEAYISNNTGKITCNKSISSIVLQVLLKSIVGQMYFDKYKTQTAQPKISNKDTHNFVLPILPLEKQSEIQQKVIESFNLSKQSKFLLESAKRAVERAIEKNEKAAIDWLKDQAGG